MSLWCNVNFARPYARSVLHAGVLEEMWSRDSVPWLLSQQRTHVKSATLTALLGHCRAVQEAMTLVWPGYQRPMHREMLAGLY